MNKHHFYTERKILLKGSNGYSRVYSVDKDTFLTWEENGIDMIAINHRDFNNKIYSIPISVAAFGITQKEILKQFGIN